MTSLRIVVYLNPEYAEIGNILVLLKFFCLCVVVVVSFFNSVLYDHCDCTA